MGTAKPIKITIASDDLDALIKALETGRLNTTLELARGWRSDNEPPAVKPADEPVDEDELREEGHPEGAIESYRLAAKRSRAEAREVLVQMREELYRKQRAVGTKPLPLLEMSPVLFRSMSATTKAARSRANVYLRRLYEVAAKVEESVEIQSVDIHENPEERAA